jgi:hypothetical protein
MTAELALFKTRLVWETVSTTDKARRFHDSPARARVVAWNANIPTKC